MSIDGIELLGRRLQFLGGYSTQDRLIKGKERALNRAAASGAYQACKIRLNEQIFNALINPDDTSVDYDDKILSIDLAVHPGDIFEWIDTDSYWLIVYPELTEKAYFKGKIRRCRYILKWLDEDDIFYETWAAITGPSETSRDRSTSNNMVVDSPFETLHILIPDNQDNKKAFARYKRFLFQDRAWEVISADYISTEGIIEFTAKETYLNKDVDDIDEGVADRVTIEKADPNEMTINGPRIWGETFIKPHMTYEYEVKGVDQGGVWSIAESNRPITLSTSTSGASLKWTDNRSGKFTLKYTLDSTIVTRQVIVESLF